MLRAQTTSSKIGSKMAASPTDRQTSIEVGNWLMKTAREMDGIRVTGSSADARNLEEALTRIKGVAARIQMGATKATKK